MMKQPIDLFSLNSYWKVLQYFCLHPSSEMYVNEVASRLGLSAGMCSRVLRDLKEIGMVEKEELGKAHYYHLVDNYITRTLKRYVGLVLIEKSGAAKSIVRTMPNTNSIVLYGSFVKGDFNEDSDIDLLIISNNKLNFNLDSEEAFLNHELSIQPLTIGKWMKLKKNKDPFYHEVIRNHIILYGAELP